MWCLKGKRAEVDSFSPGKKKLCFYVAVVRPLGRVITLVVDWFNQRNTARFLEKIRRKLRGYRIDLVWDSAPSPGIVGHLWGRYWSGIGSGAIGCRPTARR